MKRLPVIVYVGATVAFAVTATQFATVRTDDAARQLLNLEI
jgi:hypothetical protein